MQWLPGIGSSIADLHSNACGCPFRRITVSSLSESYNSKSTNCLASIVEPGRNTRYSSLLPPSMLVHLIRIRALLVRDLNCTLTGSSLSCLCRLYLATMRPVGESKKPNLFHSHVQCFRITVDFVGILRSLPTASPASDYKLYGFFGTCELCGVR